MLCISVCVSLCIFRLSHFSSLDIWRIAFSKAHRKNTEFTTMKWVLFLQHLKLYSSKGLEFWYGIGFENEVAKIIQSMHLVRLKVVCSFSVLTNTTICYSLCVCVLLESVAPIRWRFFEASTVFRLSFDLHSTTNGMASAKICTIKTLFECKTFESGMFMSIISTFLFNFYSSLTHTHTNTQKPF